MRRLIVLMATVVGYAAQASAQSEISVPQNQPYTHKASGMIFPVSVGEFVREKLVRYDDQGLDESAGYNLRTPAGHAAVTVYVYPSPVLRSLGSPATVMAGARGQLCENSFGQLKSQITQARPEGSISSEGKTSFVRTGKTHIGHRLDYRFSETSSGRSLITIAELYCYVGGKWDVKYRVTAPENFDAGPKFSQFVRDLEWTIPPEK